MESWDVCLGGLWWEDILALMEGKFLDWCDEYELIDYESDDGHHYTAYLRKRTRRLKINEMSFLRDSP